MSKRILPPNDQLKEMYESGMSARDIAESLKCSVNTVQSALSRYKITSRPPGGTAKLQYEAGREPTRYWEGKKQPPEMVEKRVSQIRGPKHYRWQDGRHSRLYRSVIDKEQCARCGTKKNLSIHHIDFDHFNNAPENLEVLCVSCHMSLHKKSYWDAVHDGKIPPTSNGPVGWGKEVKGGAVLD